MLGSGDSQTVSDTWDNLESRVALSEEQEEFLSKGGRIRSHEDRDHQRYEMRAKAVLIYEERFHAVFLKDCSRSGMAFLSPVQLFPLDRIILKAENDRRIELEIRRCRRIKDNCYECGGSYISDETN